jgi:DNA-binding transcriptional LysR family regulator
MDVFRMKCFISVAEHQSMAVAAREMLITRPAMSSQMNALEAEMGATLLIRDKKGTRLTPAGRRVLETFRQVVEELGALDEDVRRIDHRTKDHLHIGFHGPAEWQGLGGLLARFRTAHPAIEVEVAQLPWNELALCVEDGTLDAAFVELSDLQDTKGLSSVPLYEEGLCAIVRRDDPLAACDSVELGQLAQSQVLLPDTSVAPRYFRDLVTHLRSAGVNVHETGTGNISEATIVLASAGYGVAIMPCSFRQNLDDVVFVDIHDDGRKVRMGLVWRTDSKNPALEPFGSACESWDWGKR